MNQVIDLKSIKMRMDDAISFLKKDMMSLRTGRVSASMLDPVKVESYGSRVHLNQVANVSVVDPRMLSVSVWDKSMVQAVERAIHESNLGLNPIVEGQLLRIPVPETTEERRISLVKIAQSYAEKGKISVRNIRRDGMDNIKKFKKDGIISEDEGESLVNGIQKITDDAVKSIDYFFEEKKKEIMHF
ncbi:ribosome recycling factor [Candidatus Liberibacter americanus]|uniref:Ribosome-recycling factor n=1 Tax=Candidatus Liberibacter americanus str. Sao Paulo TaxID=1261131 RepID=U6B4K2_9HYPH|nr:ribosome recycling factor [Candidatus Liberibacter americanus]AHA27558.1 Ribosome recycling factor [Candidatus Liberibacter americanus str. Sao Paulo]EMS36481.1 ribosome recycling factor [Candidatus Liberibacter americanus PW_SP]